MINELCTTPGSSLSCSGGASVPAVVSWSKEGLVFCGLDCGFGVMMCYGTITQDLGTLSYILYHFVMFKSSEQRDCAAFEPIQFAEMQVTKHPVLNGAKSLAWMTGELD